MKTYKHIFEELLKEENITQCFHDAAKRKTTRPEVARVLKEETEDQRACARLHGICISLQSHNASQINPEACNKEGAQNCKERESQLV